MTMKAPRVRAIVRLVTSTMLGDIVDGDLVGILLGVGVEVDAEVRLTFIFGNGMDF